MAIRSPGFVQVTTTTTGFGPYTLTNTTPSASDYRSIANAVADGSLASGDTVQYVIFQTGVPTGKMFERGWGTINTTTLVLTVVSVTERSALLTSGGGWGAGTKDVYFAPPGAESVALLNQLNTFTQDIYIEKTSPTFALRVGGQTRGFLQQVGTALFLAYADAASVTKGAVQIGDNTLKFSPDGVTYKDIAQVNSGMKVVQFTTGAVVKMTFNCAPPTGWTRINVTGERVAKYAAAADTAEVQGGSWTISGLTFNGATDNYSLTIANLPAHDHSYVLGTGGALPGGVGAGSSSASVSTTGSAGSGTGHAHSISSQAVASGSAWRPAYEIVVKASFD